jgi:hypothetical protein
MRLTALALAAISMTAVTACQSSGPRTAAERVAAENVGTVNPYLWSAARDTFQSMPVASSDPVGGTIVYDWFSFPGAPNERIKATVYILDTRLRADGVSVAVFRQTNQGGTWVDASVDPDTARQLEAKILERARSIKASDAS